MTWYLLRPVCFYMVFYNAWERDGLTNQPDLQGINRPLPSSSICCGGIRADEQYLPRYEGIECLGYIQEYTSLNRRKCIIENHKHPPVAQQDNVLVYEAMGWEFESLRADQKKFVGG